MTVRFCNGCGTEKTLSEFDKNPYGNCKECRRKYRQENRKLIAESNKLYKEKNREAIREQRREYHKKNRDALNAKSKQYHQENISILREKQRRYVKANRGKISAYQRRWEILTNRNSYKSEWARKNRHRRRHLAFRNNISTSIAMSLRGLKKGRKWEMLVGYTVKDLRDHIELLFLPGMTWDNYGKWHVDHIIPQVAFYFTCAEDIDFRRCWALNNLQPLWAADNKKKGAKVVRPFQPCLNIAVSNDVNGRD